MGIKERENIVFCKSHESFFIFYFKWVKIPCIFRGFSEAHSVFLFGHQLLFLRFLVQSFYLIILRGIFLFVKPQWPIQKFIAILCNATLMQNPPLLLLQTTLLVLWLGIQFSSVGCRMSMFFLLLLKTVVTLLRAAQPLWPSKCVPARSKVHCWPAQQRPYSCLWASVLELWWLSVCALPCWLVS